MYPNPSLIWMDALASLLVLLALFALDYMLTREGYASLGGGRRAYKPSYPELVGRRVEVVRAGRPLRTGMPRGTVFMIVDAAGVISRDPRLPLEGLPAAQVVADMQKRFGVRWVVSDTRDTRRRDKVTVVHDPSSQRVTRVHIPRQWAMAPSTLDVRGLAVAVNPAAGTRFTRRTLALRVSPRTGLVTSATVH